MSQEAVLVHVVSPDGVRHERAFPATATPEQILAQLRHPAAARLFGRSKTVTKQDKVFGEVVPHADSESPWVPDHPETTIFIGHDDGAGNFVADKQIAGPQKADKAAKSDLPEGK